MARESIVHFSIFLNQKQDLEYHLAHELNTVSTDVSENVELKDPFCLHLHVASDPNYSCQEVKSSNIYSWQNILHKLQNCTLHQVHSKQSALPFDVQY